MNQDRSYKKGAFGEKLAAKYLQQKGFILLERNWRFQHLEIDLIARDGDELVFVEVKTRKQDDPSRPDELIPLKKQKRLIAAADAYLRMNEVDTESRFDVVIIHTGEGDYTLEHIPGAFYPGL